VVDAVVEGMVDVVETLTTGSNSTTSEYDSSGGAGGSPWVDHDQTELKNNTGNSK